MLRGPLCAELGVTRQTLYRHVTPKGELRGDGLKLLGRKGNGTRVAADGTREQVG